MNVMNDSVMSGSVSFSLYSVCCMGQCYFLLIIKVSLLRGLYIER